MKHLFPFFILTSLLLCSCQQDADEPVRSGIDIQTSIIQEAITRASLSSTVSRIDAIILDGDGNVVTNTETDATSDQIAIDVAAGAYTLILVANTGNAPTINTDGTVTYTKAGDAFSYADAVAVARDKRTSISATLNRCVAKLTFKSTDVVPSAATKFNIKLENISDTYDAINGTGTNTTSYISNGLTVSSFVTNNLFQCHVYTLLPASSITNGKLSLTFLDDSGNELYTPSWSDLPLTINRNTILTAPMFHENGGDATITLNTTWGEDITVDR